MKTRTASKFVVFKQKLLKSKAYRSLNTPTAHFVFGIFMCKRQLVKRGRPGKKQWDIVNNGEIVFSYREAHEKYGIGSAAFRNAIDELRDKGLIDIYATGMGVHKVTTLYGMSDRWKLYGTPDYIPPKPRPKGPINRGFQKGNKFGRNSRKKIPTVVEQHSSTVAGQHSKTKKANNYVATPT
jgi:hypothetical protein